MIYMDVLIVLNWFLDYILLHATARLLHPPYLNRRLVLGSLLGALFAAVTVLPTLSPYMVIPFQLFTALIIVWVSFGRATVREISVRLCVFFGLSIALAGVVLLIYTFLAPQGLRIVNGVIYYDISPFWLAIVTAVGYGIVCLYEHFATMHRLEREYQLELICDTSTVALRTLYDSGNRLSEGFSGRPVIVVDFEAVRSLLSEEECRWVINTSSLSPEAAISGKWRLVPFRSVGGEGLLPAFLPSSAILHSGKRRRDITGVYIAISPHLGRGEYKALIGTTIARTLD